MTRTNPSSKTASPAASSPDLPASSGLCAIHQPNLFPRLTTLAKLFAADTWIVLDDVQFTRRDYQHRTRLAALGEPGRTQWLSIPTHLPQGRQTAVRDALIADPDLARRRSMAMLRQYYGASPHWAGTAQALDPVGAAFGRGRTAAVAETSTRILLHLLGWQGQILRSGDLSARSSRSQRLADLTAAVGAGAYLCGTGGMKYLDEAPFAAQKLAVVPFLTPPAGIWASGRQVSALWSLTTLGPVALAGHLRVVAAAQTPRCPEA
ncbi:MULTISPECIES: WbqC family protein [unclassified Streptomyces]|uniref:WbqC family protein n=1 Tax=unclassified Streptomyces TaxID=2593676 RepID=UPI001BE64007|nr:MULTISPECIES: WbqC family protein [unclassified Streptomyces]MBT2402530.1 WbqC family protein [Streptomyces sp. ISL-21]MBT2611875.1 WbqC family protein [Streptomyces sp. ISL-87]